jgi:hypothetical protein
VRSPAPCGFGIYLLYPSECFLLLLPKPVSTQAEQGHIANLLFNILISNLFNVYFNERWTQRYDIYAESKLHRGSISATTESVEARGSISPLFWSCGYHALHSVKRTRAKAQILCESEVFASRSSQISIAVSAVCGNVISLSLPLILGQYFIEIWNAGQRL